MLKNRLVVAGSAALLTLVGCSSTDGYRPPANSVKISYSQTKVRVIIPPAMMESDISLRTIYLASNVHNRIAAQNINHPAFGFQPTSIFSSDSNAKKKNQNALVEFDLPQNAPPHVDDVCFYVTNNTGRVLPAKILNASTSGYQGTGSLYNPKERKQNEDGFVIKDWQNTFAIGGKIQGHQAEIQSLTAELDKVNKALSQAKTFVQYSPLVIDGQCTMPQPSYDKPIAPFSAEYLSHQNFIPINTCFLETSTGIPPALKPSIIAQQHRDKISAAGEQFFAALRYVEQQKDGPQANTLFVKQVNEIFAGNEYYRSCYGKACNYEKKLYQANPYRVFSHNFNQCVATTTKAINERQQIYQRDLVNWQDEPKQRFDLCESQMQIAKSGDANIRSLTNKRQALEKRLQALQALKPQRVSNYPIFSPAHKSTCSV